MTETKRNLRSFVRRRRIPLQRLCTSEHDERLLNTKTLTSYSRDSVPSTNITYYSVFLVTRPSTCSTGNNVKDGYSCLYPRMVESNEYPLPLLTVVTTDSRRHEIFDVTVSMSFQFSKFRIETVIDTLKFVPY